MPSSKDKTYLSFQIQNKLYSLNGSGFQSFFEQLMLAKHGESFKVVRPYGNVGDGGNDGYIPKEGIYYQVFSPLDATEKDGAAAKKFSEDFEKLEQTWSKFSEIKNFNFVYNNKFQGTSLPLETAITKLRIEKPGISFSYILANDIETLCLTLTNEQLEGLGFIVDSRDIVRVLTEQLSVLELKLDKGNIKYVTYSLNTIENEVLKTNNNQLICNFYIIKARTLQRNEQLDEAVEIYLSTSFAFPSDVRAKLYLAEIKLNHDEIEENQRLLDESETIDSNHWLLKLQKIIRETKLNCDLSSVELSDSNFPEDNRHRADFYRIHSLIAFQIGNEVLANSYIQRAILLNGSKYQNKELCLSMKVERILAEQIPLPENLPRLNDLLDEINKLEAEFSEDEELPVRYQMGLWKLRAHVYLALINNLGFIKSVQEILSRAVQCDFDSNIDYTLTHVLKNSQVPKDTLFKLCTYLKSSTRQPSSELSKIIFLQSLNLNELNSIGRQFFIDTSNTELIELIDAIESSNYTKASEIILKDESFAVLFLISGGNHTELKNIILSGLPSNGIADKRKLQLLLSHEAGNYDMAFSILKQLDLSQINYYECIEMYRVAHVKKAWDIEVILLSKILEFEADEGKRLDYKLKLFFAYVNLEIYIEVIKLGTSLLDNVSDSDKIGIENKTIVAGQTVFAYYKRTKYPEALAAAKKYSDALTGGQELMLLAEILLKNDQHEEAIMAIVNSVKAIGRPTPEEYGNLYFQFIQITNKTGFNSTNEESTRTGLFVKLANEDTWYFLGEGDALDATKISTNLTAWLNKKVGDSIELGTKYGAMRKVLIEKILTISKYILHQSVHHAHKLSMDGTWDKMQMIEVPAEGDGIDTSNLIQILKDQQNNGSDFFELYCTQELPFAMLCASEHGLPNALGRILNERRGFIKFSNGSQADIDNQISVASELIESQNPFYIDGTSALFLAEAGLLESILHALPNLKVPQSVIIFLLEMRERFEIVPGQTGRMGLQNDEISFSGLDIEGQALVRERIAKSVDLLEERTENIGVISKANKSDVFSEMQIQNYLCDATILSQKEGVPVVTDDYLYLQMNVLETNKEIPKYSSSFALVKALYLHKILTFESYLNYFGYLSSYRLRFLPLNIDEMEKALFGDTVISVFNVQNLRKLNLPLTLSEDYGVPTKVAHQIALGLMLRITSKNSVLVNEAEDIFKELVDSFPTNQNSYLFANALIEATVKVLNQIQPVMSNEDLTKQKVNALKEKCREFRFKTKRY